MADDLERTLLIKNLENTKLRQRIKELETESIQIKTKHTEELSILTHENENFKRQNEFEIRTKIRQLQQNTQNLTEELAEARNSQCKAEEEVVVINEKNFQLTYDLKNMQQENEKCKTEMMKLSTDSVKKEYELQKALVDLQKLKQQCDKLQEELANVNTYFKGVKTELLKKDSQILKLTNYLDESTESVQHQETLEETIRELQADKTALQLELKEIDANRNSMAEILLKNKELVAENRKLKAQNDKLANETSKLENELIHHKDNTEELKYTLEARHADISELKEKTASLETELQEISLALKNKEELLKTKGDLEKENRFLKKRSKANETEIETINQSVASLVNERCNLKQRIDDLEKSNFQKIQYIAKLKAASDQSINN